MTAPGPAAPRSDLVAGGESGPPRRLVTALLLAALFVPYLYLFPHLGAANNPNENVRLYMTKALVDHATFAIGWREPVAPGAKAFRDVGSVHAEYGYVNDRALVCTDPALKPPDCAGPLYAAKAPGTSLLGVPVYAALKPLFAALDHAPSKIGWLFWLRLFCVIVPVLLMLVGFERLLRGPVPDLHLRASLVIGLGWATTVYGYAGMFAGHSLAAAALFGGFYAIHGLGPRAAFGWRPALRAAAAGFCTGYAVITEYPSLVGALLLAGYVLWRVRSARLCACFVAGALPAGALGAWFHQAAFGAVWRTPYGSLENLGFVQDIAPGFMGIHAPNLEAFAGSLFAPFNGLFFFSPWSVLAIPALVGLAWWRRPALGAVLAVVALALAATAAVFVTPWAVLALPLVVLLARVILRPVAAEPGPAGSGLAALVFLGYVLFVSAHSLWRGGWTVGPRYIVMAAPFTALLVALAVGRWARRAPFATRTLLSGLVVASVFVTLGTGLVSQGYPFEYYNPVFEVGLRQWSAGYVFQSLGSALGLRGHASLLPLYVVVGLTLLYVLFGASGAFWRRLTGGFLATALAAAVLALLATPERAWNEDKAEMLRWQRNGFEPADQAALARRALGLKTLRQLGTLPPAASRELARALTRLHDSGLARIVAVEATRAARAGAQPPPSGSTKPASGTRMSRPAWP